MKQYELTIVGRKWIELEDDENIEDYIDALTEGNGDQFDSYQDLDELINDMEFDALEWR